MKSKITFVGSGNVAWHLAKAFDLAGYQIHQIISRNETSGKEMAKKYAAFFDTKPENIFTPEDFRKLYASLFASQFSPDEMTEELFDYIFHNTIVNDDAEIGVNEDGDFIAPTKRSERGITDTGWVIVDFKKRRDPLWRQAHEAVGKINDSATELGIFNPLRPYFIIPRDIDLTAVNSKVEVNPLAIK